MSQIHCDHRFALTHCSVTSFGFIQNFLWSNAGFASLRKLKLREYDPRPDPTVIPINARPAAEKDGSITSDLPYNPSPKHPNRQYNIGDYQMAFNAGKLTPLAVAEALLDLAGSAEHKVAFLSVKRDQVLAAAKASTQRHKDGKVKGPLDGVPLAVKGECYHLLGFSKSNRPDSSLLNEQTLANVSLSSL